MELILLVIAIVLFILAGAGIQAGRVNLGWIGMALFAATFLPLG
jgi:hypothetical protein